MDLLNKILSKTAEEIGWIPVSIKEAWGGFLSRAFIVEMTKDGVARKVFVRMRKNENPSVYDDIDQMDAFSRTHLSGMELIGHPKSLFVAKVTTVNGANIVIHWQEFREPTESCLDYEKLINSDSFEQEDEEKIKDIARKIAKLHKQELRESDRSEEVYARSVMELMINPELTYPTLSHYPAEHPYFGTNERKYEYLSMMNRACDEQVSKKNSRRCSKIHGDFWNSNILFDKDGCYFVDFSRVPVGEPGIDVGWFLGNLAVDAYVTWKIAPRRAFKSFAKEYVEESWDSKVLENSYFPLFWIGIIRLFPPVYWNGSWEKAEKVLKLIKECYLKKSLFIPE